MEPAAVFLAIGLYQVPHFMSEKYHSIPYSSSRCDQSTGSQKEAQDSHQYACLQRATIATKGKQALDSRRPQLTSLEKKLRVL